MPLKLNVGLNRKIGEANYGSRGASVNVELEVDSSLAGDPTKLQERIRQLFSLVRTSLAEELNGGNGHKPHSNGHNGGQNKDRGFANDQDSGQDNGPRTNLPRPATQSQIKALYAISKSQGLDLYQLLRERFRIGKPEALSIREASQLIDELKSSENQQRG